VWWRCNGRTQLLQTSKVMGLGSDRGLGKDVGWAVHQSVCACVCVCDMDVEALGYSVYLRANLNGSAASPSGVRAWQSVTTSATGDRFAAVEGGNVHTYFNGTWALRPTFALGAGLSSNNSYSSISSSGSGKDLIATARDGRIFLSATYGETAILLANIGKPWRMP